MGDCRVARLVTVIHRTRYSVGRAVRGLSLWDLDVAGLFFDPHSAKFPLAVDYSLNVVRRIANWVPFLLLAPAVFALLRKLVFPQFADANGTLRRGVPHRLVLLGPALTANALLKENWGRPRPNFVQQFAGTDTFQPWWHPSSACKRNCSFVSGEASQAYWTVAPASLAPPQLRPIALGGAVLFGTAVGGLRVVFGRHFVTDIIFAGVITIAIIMALYSLLLDPIRRNDARVRTVDRGSRPLGSPQGSRPTVCATSSVRARSVQFQIQIVGSLLVSFEP